MKVELDPVERHDDSLWPDPLSDDILLKLREQGEPGCFLCVTAPWESDDWE